ncbi:hypothetical protein AOQ84DRAFT_143664 [Glonium stellatum]|uniref:Uncharacterized protein n=1 Tax=Glonium stellatum TaxID=574774 RepID=A0A8E2F8V6_9PEZI|nr:hypothetical protein AOQ84DRAFT_143664 [Glonium stellatum]
MAEFKVIILGAGLVGSLLANGLLHNRVDFMVYERDEKDSKREGYQIRLGAPALAGFKACSTQDQRDDLLPKFCRSDGVLSSAPTLYDTHFNCLLDLAKFPAYAKSAPIDRVVLRDFPAKPIYDAEKLKYGKKFKAYQVVQDATGKTSVTVIFEDGTQD